MIVWSGRGILSVLVLVVSFVLFTSILPQELGDYGIVVGFFATGAFSWFMGKKWNEADGRTMIDKASGQEVHLTPNHSLFWIKMQYWGPVFGILGIVILIQQFI